jgi:hypothetical protein
VFSDSPGPAVPDNFTTGYSFGLESPGILLTGTAVWHMPVTIRCDNQWAGRSPGCVFPASRPVLYLSEATYGAAAVNVQVGQLYVAGVQGTTASPLTRGDPNLSQGNRDSICDSTFVPNNTVTPTDSCDEYPFASSQQSGGARGLTGANCLETRSYNVNGTWYVQFLNTDTGTQVCERGHVPLALNTAVGSQVGALYTNNRMLLGDPYTILVTV